MSPILLMTLIICAVFACAFGLCEWLASARAKGEPLSSPDFGDDRREGGEAPKPAARRRAAERLERQGGSGAD